LCITILGDQPVRGKQKMTKDCLDLLVNLERNLHRKSIRRSKDMINELLHDDFEEIGASGNIFNKDQMIEELLYETPFTINASDFELRMFSEDIAQLKYKTKNTENKNLTRTTLRSSIWKNEGSKWKMIFHQGTVVQSDK
jgi:hypothetical protein